jgi:DNA-binding SARP family transcriptional activator
MTMRRRARWEAVVEFKLLGPLEVTHEERSVRLGGARQTAVVATMLLRANQRSDR